MRRNRAEPRRKNAASKLAVSSFLLLMGCSRSGDATSHAPPAPVQAPATVIRPTVEAPPPPPSPESTAIPLEPDPLRLPGSHSTSIGTPVEGRLEGGVPLPREALGLRWNPAKNPSARHGTVELVSALLRAAAMVEAEFPGGALTVGDLSMPEGGDIPGHASHRNGRDVDVSFYLLDETGAPAPGKSIPIEPDGTGVDYRDLSTSEDDVPFTIDLPRTWAFLQALVLDDAIAVHRIFVVEHVRTSLLEHARAKGAPKAAIDRFADLTCQPAFPHDDHMHIRVFCTPEDIALGCEDAPPIYPWHAERLSRAGTRAKLAGKRSRPRPALTSTEQAEKKAKEKFGAFAPEVEAFLERRKAWAKQPHPGRRYCR